MSGSSECPTHSRALPRARCSASRTRSKQNVWLPFPLILASIVSSLFAHEYWALRGARVLPSSFSCRRRRLSFGRLNGKTFFWANKWSIPWFAREVTLPTHRAVVFSWFRETQTKKFFFSVLHRYNYLFLILLQFLVVDMFTKKALRCPFTS